ncbi:hypothetical protein D3C72_1135120 [compost metagenome]
MSDSVVFAVLGARHKRYSKYRSQEVEEIVALDWRPVPAHEGADRWRLSEVAASVKWCETATMADVTDVFEETDEDPPFGVFVAIVRISWSYGPEEATSDAHLIACHPVSLFAWDTGFARSAAETVVEHDAAMDEIYGYWEARAIVDDAGGFPLTKADAERVEAIDARWADGVRRRYNLQCDGTELVLGPLSPSRCPG